MMAVEVTALEDRMLKVSEAAERLRVTEETVRRWLRSKKLKGTKISATRGGYRIPTSEVERMLKGEE